jgi:succinyl-CoA synthetase beta subunit
VDLFEFQGKSLFAELGVPVPEGRPARTPAEARAAAEELGGTVVVKAQVQVGGRGKAGGIKLAETPDEAEARASEILGMDIKGHTVHLVWVEKAPRCQEAPRHGERRRRHGHRGGCGGDARPGREAAHRPRHRPHELAGE